MAVDPLSMFAAAGTGIAKGAQAVGEGALTGAEAIAKFIAKLLGYSWKGIQAGGKGVAKGAEEVGDLAGKGWEGMSGLWQGGGSGGTAGGGTVYSSLGSGADSNMPYDLSVTNRMSPTSDGYPSSLLPTGMSPLGSADTRALNENMQTQEMNNQQFNKNMQDSAGNLGMWGIGQLSDTLSQMMMTFNTKQSSGREKTTTTPTFERKQDWFDALGINRTMQVARNRAILGLPISLSADVSSLTQSGKTASPEGFSTGVTRQKMEQDVARGGGLESYLGSLLGRSMESHQQGFARLNPNLGMLGNIRPLQPPQGTYTREESNADSSTSFNGF